jgi:hypothetical protein
LANVDEHFNEKLIKGKRHKRDILLSCNDTKLERKILLSENKLVFFESNKHASLELFTKASKNLQNHKLGVISKEKKILTNRTQATCFIKVDPNDLKDEKDDEKRNEENLKLMNNLMMFHVDIEDYKSTFQKRKLEETDTADEEEFIQERKKPRH